MQSKAPNSAAVEIPHVEENTRCCGAYIAITIYTISCTTFNNDSNREEHLKTDIQDVQNHNNITKVFECNVDNVSLLKKVYVHGVNGLMSINY